MKGKREDVGSNIVGACLRTKKPNLNQNSTSEKNVKGFRDYLVVI
jgi:hypothetical protein